MEEGKVKEVGGSGTKGEKRLTFKYLKKRKDRP